MNTLYYGDNLEILREYIPDESVDLIYLDPPFNSKQAYNVIFKDKKGKYPPSQIEAFDDTWHWGDENEEILVELMKPQYPPELVQMLHAFQSFLGNSDMMSYLVMMAIRLYELHRVLKPTGTIYLHCDPTASHYLKVIMDRIYGSNNYLNEIIWKRTSAHSASRKWNQIHDVLLCYTKSGSWTWNTVYCEYDKEYVERFYRHVESETGRQYRLSDLSAPGIRHGSSGKPWRGVDPTAKGRHWAVPGYVREMANAPKDAPVQDALEKLDHMGRIVWPKKTGGVPSFKRYLDEMPGTEIKSVITDIPPISPQSAERQGYPTQKPLALLERIIQASSNEGDVVMDPFCGCGTAVVAAEQLGRKWIGIDITILAVNLIEKRLKENFPGIEFKIVGIPTDVPSAKRLAADDKFDFEKWFVTALGGQPYKSSGGGDTGIDGFLYARDVKGKLHNVIISVKGGGYGPGAVRDLKGVVEREGAIAGLLLALRKPSKQADAEAASAGRFQMPEVERSYPKVQVFTVEDYFAGKRPDLPDTSGTLKKAARVKREREKDQKLPLENGE